MSEYIYASLGEPLAHIDGEITLARKEIVRCKSCKHYDSMNDDEGMCMVPDDDGDYARWMVDAVGYCYLGERSGE